MAAVNKIDSNITGLSFAEEASLGVVSSPIWYPLEPNSYPDFGGEIQTIARNPINPSRQRKKGVVTGLGATGGFNTDLTQNNIQSLLQGFFFASLRTKDELSVATVDGTNNDYEPAAGGDGYVAGDLLFAKGFSSAANNGLKIVTGSPGASTVPVTDTGLVDGATQSGIISRVGYQFGADDIDVDASGSFPAITSTTKDFEELGLTIGEWVFIGGDTAGTSFTNSANNGFARVRTIDTNRVEFDKTQNTMVDETSTGSKTLRIFFGRVLKNESVPANIVRRSYQLERTLGAPDDAQPSQIQSEYLIGAVANELSLNIPSQEKITVDLSFVGTDVEQRTGVTGVKSGTRATLQEEDAFNTSSDFSRIKLAIHDDADAAPTPLFAYAEEISLTISNGITPNNAVGVLGAFDVSAGSFIVSGSMTVYFQNITAIQAVRNNSDITFDAHVVKSNKGITIDVPLISLGDGKPAIEQDQPIKLPLTTDAATGAKIDANLNHTLLMVFWDYLPDAADV